MLVKKNINFNFYLEYYIIPQNYLTSFKKSRLEYNYYSRFINKTNLPSVLTLILRENLSVIRLMFS